MELQEIITDFGKMVNELARQGLLVDTVTIELDQQRKGVLTKKGLANLTAQVQIGQVKVILK